MCRGGFGPAASAGPADEIWLLHMEMQGEEDFLVSRTALGSPHANLLRAEQAPSLAGTNKRCLMRCNGVGDNRG